MIRNAFFLVAFAILFAAGCRTAQPITAQPYTVNPMPPPPPSANFPKLGGKVVTTPIKGVPLVAFRVMFQAGSVDDPVGKEGLTALTARMFAEGGTVELTSAELLEALFPMAASIDVQTDKELTVFFGEVHRDYADRFLDLLVAALTRPRWDPNELKRMRDDALEDIQNRLRTSDDEGLGKAALDTLMWRGHPYAHYEGGTVQGLKSIVLEDVKFHASQVFTQDRMLVGLGGDVDEKLARELRAKLNALPDQGAPLVSLPSPRPADRRVLLVQKDAQSTALSLGYPWALRRDNPDFFKMMVAVSALGEHRQFSGRLMRSLRVERGLNYGDYAYVEHFAQAGESTFPMLNVARRQQDFTVWLRPVATENQLFAIRAALFVLERYAKNGMTQAELDQTRGFMEGYTLLWEQTPMRRLGYAMDDMFYGVEMGFLERFRASLKKMQLADVNQAVAKWLRPGNLEIAAVTKDGETLRMAMLEDAPSPIHYVAEKPSPNVLAEDEKIVRLPLDLLPDKAVIEPATELFER